ncbi:MAG: urease accessory protein UreD [Pseudomonadota bacterium]|nr:urease accessory protein UreD [Pseudomonadota bacterium]
MNTQVTLPAVTPAHAATCWHASLALRLQRGAAGTRIAHSRHDGPLYVQRPFYPEGRELAHVYLLHPPGGLVSGDRLQVELDLAPAALVLCTTPGAGRLYRARRDQRLQEQRNLLKVAAGAHLEWFPQETIVFPGAHAALDTQVALAPGARFIGWELAVLGLPANAQRFDSGQLQQRLRVDVDGKPALIERLSLDPLSPLHGAACGLQGQMVSGVFVCGPFPAQPDDAVIDALRSIHAQAPARCGITRLGAFLVGRYLGNCAQEARRCFVAFWQLLRPLLLQRAACMPAIWST